MKAIARIIVIAFSSTSTNAHILNIQEVIQKQGQWFQASVSNALHLSQISTQISNGKPFIARWDWNTGGGHFAVGHSVNGNNVYDMNPWFGKGLHIHTFNWLVDDGQHLYFIKYYL